jgi:predicted aminopeptidase
MRPVLLSSFFLFALLALGCTPVRYVTQAAAGQEQINRRGIAIQELVEGEHLDKRTRGLLAHVPRIKAFGERHGLARTKNYQRYVWLGRPAVVWVVSASHPLAFRAMAWKFPIVGSITYTGWFDQEEARSYAATIATRGWDVDVRPSQAYSTLGWFDDPILSTMIAPGEDALGDLADVVLHETLHATFYVPGQSTLNESVASFVGDELALRYLDETVGPDAPEKAEFVAVRERAERRGLVMRDANEALSKLYASGLPRERKLAEKKRIIDRLRADLEIKRPINNATLIQYRTYGSGRAEMKELLGACGGDFPKMLRALERSRPLAEREKLHADPAIFLRKVIAAGC